MRCGASVFIRTAPSTSCTLRTVVTQNQRDVLAIQSIRPFKLSLV